MKFFERPTLYHLFRRLRLAEAENMGPLDWLHQMWPTFSDPFLRAQMNAECRWLAERRPYYSVYPAVVEALARVTLDLDCALIRLPLPRLLITFAEQAPLVIGAGDQRRELRSILAATIDQCVLPDGSHAPGLAIWCDFGESAPMPSGPEMPIASYRNITLRPGRTVEQELAPETIAHLETDSTREDSLHDTTAAMRVVVAVCLMRDDPTLVVPDVLAADQDGYDDTADPKYVERAHRRGKVGWRVGAHIEVAPHFRRPHFGLRWTGPGRAIPRVRPIKGCVVHRKKITEAPSGYLDDAAAPGD